MTWSQDAVRNKYVIPFAPFLDLLVDGGVGISKYALIRRTKEEKT